MILEQYYLGCLSHASYLIGDQESATAVVVDPQRDVNHYLDRAGELGLAIRHVFLTHFHADFLAGHLELREQTGAAIHLGARAEAEFAFTPMREGDRLSLGTVTLSILETPGHTPESISILVHPHPEAAPHAVLTGDTLFVGDVGRPDLMASEGISERELASLLHASLHDKLLKLPEATLVYPAHGAGSMCGRNLSRETVSTIGDQKRLNPSLQPMSRDQFIDLVTGDQPAAPAYFAYDASLNKKERPTLEENLARVVVPLSLDQLLRHQNAGALVLDVRPPGAFARGHLAGSLSVGLDGQFATWVGTLVAPLTPIAIVAAPGDEEEAAMRLGRIGFDRVLGYLEGGMAAAEEHEELIQSFARLAPRDLSTALESADRPLVLDVRTAGEYAEQHLEGSLHIPLPEMESRLDEIPRDRNLVALCRSGYRSIIAASLLERHGRSAVTDLEGGIIAWQGAHAGTP